MAGADTYVPEPGPDGLRHWSVAGGVVRDGEGRVLLVRNRRRNGATDWTTPGGVIDPGESSLAGLGREVTEETGLVVSAWHGPLYRVEVTAPGFGFVLRVEAHLAQAFSGSLRVDDPDGIVVDAEFVDSTTAVARLDEAPEWVREPLVEHLEAGVADGRTFAYRLEGSSSVDRQVIRIPGPSAETS